MHFVVVAVGFEILIDRNTNLREQPRLVYLKIGKQVDDSWTIGRCFVRWFYAKANELVCLSLGTYPCDSRV